MWNRLGIPSVTRFTALKIAVINAKKLGYPCWLSNESTWFQGQCTMFYSCFGNCRRLAYKISAYEMCMICSKLIAACKIRCKSPSWWPDGLIMLDWFTVHQVTFSAYIRESAYGWPSWILASLYWNCFKSSLTKYDWNAITNDSWISILGL